MFEGEWGYLSAAPIKQTICTDSWWFHVYSVDTDPPLTSHSLSSHHHTVSITFSLPGLLGLHLLSPAQKQQNTIIQKKDLSFFFFFFFFLFALGEHSNSLYGWRPLQIRQRTGECVTLDRQPGESQVDTWQVIKSQLCPHVGGSALGQMETVTVEV